MKLRIRFNYWWFKLPWNRGTAGFVFYPWVMFKRSPEEVTDRLFRHEMEHVYQVQRDGWFTFYLKWLFWTIRYGYRNNPYEVEARAVQDTPLTDNERDLKENG